MTPGNPLRTRGVIGCTAARLKGCTLSLSADAGRPADWTDPLVSCHNLGGMQRKPAASWNAGVNTFQLFSRTGLSHNPADDKRYLFDIETEFQST